MRKIILAMLLAAPLAACGTVGAIPLIGPIVSAAVSIPGVQQAVTIACGLNVAYQDVSRLIGATPNATIEQLASMICGAPVIASVKRGAGRGLVLNVNGVLVHATRN